MLRLSDHPGGVILPVRAQPGAKANAIRGEHAGALKVAVIQVAEKGRANGSIAELLAYKLDLKRSQIELLSGESQRQKNFLIRGITAEELSAKIASALEK